MKKNLKNRLGFTLIELLVVISIIGVLTAIIVPNMMGMRERARDSKRKSALKELKTALRLYYNDHQAYPPSTTDDSIDCGGTACAWGSPFEVNGVVYMKELPHDDTNQYHYQRYNSGEAFRAWVELENSADQEIESSQTKCQISPSDTYYSELGYYVCSD